VLFGLILFAASVNDVWTGMAIYGGITVIVSVIVLLDWLARRKDRRSNRAV